MPPPFEPQQLYHKNHIHETPQTIFSEVLLCACVSDMNHVLLLGKVHLFSAQRNQYLFSE